MLARVVSKSTRTRTWTCAPLGFSGLARRWINTGESILAGDDIPLKVVRNGEPKDESINSLFKGKKVAVFGVPGAFTPVCTGNHLPGYVQNADAFKSKGIDEIVCLTVNDPAVSSAWANHVQTGDKVAIAADWNLALTDRFGQKIDLSEAALGQRSKRFAAIVEDGTVTHISTEENPGKLEVSSAETLLERL